MRYPRLYKFTIGVHELTHKYYTFRYKIDPYLVALFTLIVAMLVFKRTLQKYIP